MQAAVDLDLFKKHVRADDFADDDAYLAHLLATAEQAVVNETQRSREELVKMGGGQWPQPIMMLGAHWYNQRESASSAQFSEVPNALQALVKPYRRLVK